MNFLHLDYGQFLLHKLITYKVVSDLIFCLYRDVWPFFIPVSQCVALL
jgi:hypothetical protein